VRTHEEKVIEPTMDKTLDDKVLEMQLRIRKVQLAAAYDVISALQRQTSSLPYRRPPTPSVTVVHASQLEGIRPISKGSVSVVLSATLRRAHEHDENPASKMRVALKIPRANASTSTTTTTETRTETATRTRTHSEDAINNQSAVLHEVSLQLPDHPGIVRPLGVVVMPAELASSSSRHNVLALVTELWEGGTLEDFLSAAISSAIATETSTETAPAKTTGPPSIVRIRVRDVIFVARRLSSALDALHRANLIHGDVCARNVVVKTTFDKIEDAAIIDFNLCSPMNRRLQEHQVERRLESGYHAPDTVLTGKTDVYSLGHTVAQMCRAAKVSTTRETSSLKAIEQIAHACLRPDPALRPHPQDILNMLTRL